MPETLLSPILTDLLDCVCAALGDTDAGAPACFCALMPGQIVPGEFCSCGGAGCGMGWVRLDRLFPSSERFPIQDATTKGSCANVLAAVIEVGAYRCRSVGDARGNPPPPATRINETLTHVADAMALHRAIGCCTAVTSRRHVLGPYTPADRGDCGGGSWTVTVQLTR